MTGKRLRRIVWCLFLLCSSLGFFLAESVTVTYQLREEQIRGTFVGNVERDMLTQGHLNPQDAVNLKFTLSATGSPHSSLFTINETTSTIRTSEKIDRESVCPGQAECEVRLSIAVYKRGEGSALDLFKLWYAVINIIDMNDNAPTFPQPFVSLSVPESVPPNHVLRTSGAEDKDKGGRNSVQEYRLSPQSYIFGLKVVENPDGSSDLGIVIKEQLDREKQELYQLKVVVTDGGYPQKTGSLTVNITVTDINDNRPIFVRSSYNVSVEENVTPNIPVLQVSATDLDQGLNGRVTYSFSSRVSREVTDHFQMDANTGVISSHGALDYESQQQYQFLVEAQDQGSPQLSGAVVVILNVQDVNDNAPRININLTPGGNNVTEDEPVGKFIAHVSVSDRDSGENSMVICAMQDDHFTLQKFYDHAHNMYKVLLSSPLDFEAASSHRVTITCRDGGVPQMVNVTSFTVHVRDVNDNAPLFARQAYTASVLENQLDGADLLQVSAHDPDTGADGEVLYRLESSASPNITRVFSLDPVSGWLRVRSPLDRELHARYNLLVLAMDGGKPSLTSSARVVISVEDENDEKPYFTRSLFHCPILERQPVGTRVCNLTAVDGDSDRFSHMHFSIVQGVGDARLFALSPSTGELRSRAVFDRERRHSYRVDFLQNFARDNLVVAAENKGAGPPDPLFYDLANVTIEVLDDNDNAPVIHYPRDGHNAINVSYSIRERTILATVNATDDDEGIFAQLSYLLVGGDPSQLFDLNQHDGTLRLARTILPKDVKEYVLQLEVKDGGNPPFIQRTELHVAIVTGNLTLVEASEDSDHNMVIVIVLVCVTVVLAMAVLITICLIRHIDKERQVKRSAAISKAEEEKMFRLKNQEAAFMNLTPQASGGGGNNGSGSDAECGVNGGKNNRKKEVSFSLDEGVGSLNTSSSGSANNMSTFRSSLDNNKHIMGSADNGLSGQGTVPGSHGLRAALDDAPHLHPVQEEEGCQYLEMVKRGGEDALSESSGETGTSDSGRGNSEDDSHSNRGSAMIGESEGQAVYQQHPYPRNPAAAPSFVGTNALSVKGRHYGGRHTSGSSSAPGRSSRHPPSSSPHVSFSGNLEFLGESSTDRDADFLPPPPPDILEEPAPAPAAMERNFSTFGFPAAGGTNSYRSMLHSHPGGHQHAGYGGVCTSLVKNSPSPTPPPLGLGMDGGSGSRKRWGSPSFNDEDDRTTTSTTSGSYVLSHDDLPRAERDEMSFSNMMV
ncbi:hypothetical protein ACOMHN_032617 [Nucella lapillus]